MPPVNILRLTPKCNKLMRPTVGGYLADRASLEKYSNELFEMVASGKLDILIHDVYPLKDVARAHQDIESRKTKGKLLIKL